MPFVYLFSPAEVSCRSLAVSVVVAWIVVHAFWMKVSVYTASSCACLSLVCRSLVLYLCSPLSDTVHLLHSSSALIVFYATKQPQDAHLRALFLFTSTSYNIVHILVKMGSVNTFSGVSEWVWYPPSNIGLVAYLQRTRTDVMASTWYHYLKYLQADKHTHTDKSLLCTITLLDTHTLSDKYGCNTTCRTE